MSNWVRLSQQDIQLKACSKTHNVTQLLEQGKLLSLTEQDFPIFHDEKVLLSDALIDKKRKNISYCPVSNSVKGAVQHQSLLLNMMRRYANFSRQLVESCCPDYVGHLRLGKVSFRPVEACARQTSITKDDSRLHIDAFPSNPVAGKRILRVFTNINPEQIPRHWLLGESFDKVLQHHQSKLKLPSQLNLALLDKLGITKTRRTLYDAIMLQLHDSMKLDHDYQQNVESESLSLPAGSTWLVFTDQVSHAVSAGQYVLEQTIYLPVEAMQYPQSSPLHQLQQLFGQPLIH